jgi:N-acetylmuramoyl-L-alanine amidase
MVQVVKQLIKDTKFKFGTSNGKRYITIHETDNTAKGADAQAHANLQSKGNSRQASWHYTVDDKEAIQSFDHKFQLWHAGDGAHDGNLHSIAIEICVNSDGDYKKAVQNAIELTKQIMASEHIPIGNVVQHNHWSGKDCPDNLRSGAKGINWNQFVERLKPIPKVEYKLDKIPAKRSDLYRLAKFRDVNADDLKNLASFHSDGWILVALPDKK